MIEIIGPALSQWDTGRSVKVTDIEADYVHFANKGDAKAVIMELVDSQAKIPDYLFQTGKQLCVYAVKDGVTVESKVFYIKTRERPENYVYDDDQRNYIYELISKAETAIEGAYSAYENANHAVEAANTAIVSANVAVENANESADSAKQAAKNANEAADKANHAAKDAVKTVNGIGPDENGNVVVEGGGGGNVDLTGYATEEWVREGYQPKGEYLTEHQDISGKLDASALPTAINTALAQAKASGEFDGKNGTSATHSWNGTTLTITSASGTSSADLKGEPGKDYTLTDSDKQEIAELTAPLVDVPSGGGNEWTLLADVTLTEAVRTVDLAIDAVNCKEIFILQNASCGESSTQSETVYISGEKSSIARGVIGELPIVKNTGYYAWSAIRLKIDAGRVFSECVYSDLAVSTPGAVNANLGYHKGTRYDNVAVIEETAFKAIRLQCSSGTVTFSAGSSFKVWGR